MQRYCFIRTTGDYKMNFEEDLKFGYAKKVPIDKLRVDNLIRSSEQAIKTAKTIFLNENSAKTILRELYEGLREFCEAIGYMKGYKFLSHEAITNFISNILKDEETAMKFDRYRKIRNGINYYGKSIETETVKYALKEIPELIKELKKYF